MNGPNDELPWLDDDENVSPEDRELPTSVGLFDQIPVLRDPLRQLSDDEE